MFGFASGTHPGYSARASRPEVLPGLAPGTCSRDLLPGLAPGTCSRDLLSHKTTDIYSHCQAQAEMLAMNASHQSCGIDTVAMLIFYNLFCSVEIPQKRVVFRPAGHMRAP